MTFDPTEAVGDNRNCPICGQFMEKHPSSKYAVRWVCRECNIVEYDREMVRSKYKRRPKKPSQYVFPDE